jgi:DNA (cytosine-5)-methyltransferase 1
VTLTVGSLFSGIGGFDLGLERAGMRVVWQCEQDPFCRRVLAQHWPSVPCHPDVRALVADTASCNGSSKPEGDHDGRALVGGVARAGGGTGSGRAATRSRRVGGDQQPGSEGDVRGEVPVPVPYVDVLCGGFPCQDISLAGRGAGLAGERSGLWREFARLIGELRPRYVLVENVPALTSRGLDVVLADLAACGFDAEYDHLPASAFGAPHRRDRVWVVGYRRDDLWPM